MCTCALTALGGATSAGSTQEFLKDFLSFLAAESQPGLMQTRSLSLSPGLAPTGSSSSLKGQQQIANILVETQILQGFGNGKAFQV